MNIGIFHADISAVGGIERVIVNLANAFCENNNVHIISIISNNEEIIYKIDSRVSVEILSSHKGRARDCYVEAGMELHKYLKRNPLDIILFMTPICLLYIPFMGRGSVKKIACERMTIKSKIYMKGRRGLFLKLMKLFAIVSCQRIVTLTREDMDEHIRKYRVSPEKITYIYNWIDSSVCCMAGKQPIEERKRIITVGRLCPQKGYDLLIHVATGILKKYPEWEWHIYGDGTREFKENMQKWIDAAGIQNQLKLCGKVNDLQERYNNYSFYVMTSYYEGMPNVLLEAKSKKLPIISFACPTGPNEIIENDLSGFLIPCYDIGKMENAIKSLIDNKKQLISFSVASQKNIDRFLKENILIKWYKLFDELMQE